MALKYSGLGLGCVWGGGWGGWVAGQFFYHPDNEDLKLVSGLIHLRYVSWGWYNSFVLVPLALVSSTHPSHPVLPPLHGEGMSPLQEGGRDRDGPHSDLFILVPVCVRRGVGSEGPQMMK